MKEHFVNYTQALALKELGFNEPCLLEEYFEDSQCVSEWAYEEPFKINTELDHLTDKFNADDDEHYEYSVAVPHKQQVFKWFRDKYNIYGMVTYYGKKQWFIEILDYKGNDLIKIEHNTFWSCEEAESACIDKLIELIKEKKS